MIAGRYEEGCELIAHTFDPDGTRWIDPMGMTAIEKVLASRGGCASVRPGDVVEPTPDAIMIHDNVVIGAKQELDSIGIDRIAAPEKVIMVSDHEVLYGSLGAARMGAFNRAAAAQWGVEQFYDVGRGGHGHLFPMERGIVLPGMMYFDNDRHATNAGAVGAFGFRMGAEISRVLATGTNWVIVPKSIRLDVSGTPGFGVYPRDIGFFLAKQFAPGGQFECDLDYMALEFAGATDQFSTGRARRAVQLAHRDGRVRRVLPAVRRDHRLRAGAGQAPVHADLCR